MMRHKPLLLILLVLYVRNNEAAFAYDDYTIKVSNDGPIVEGGTINFKVEVYEGNKLSTSTFEYYWTDDGIPRHTRETNRQNATDFWSVTYPRNHGNYMPGTYVVRVSVSHCVFIMCYGVGSAGTEFQITESANGNITLVQNNTTRDGNFVSNAGTTIHEVTLKKSDYDVIIKAPSVLTYWFVDCIYYGITSDLKFPFNYTKAEENHRIEALVVADFTPPKPTTTVAPTTTTTTTSKPTVTPSKTTSTTKATTTTKKSDTTHAIAISKRSASDNVTSNIKIKANGTLVPYNVSFPYVCNSTELVKDRNKTYGYFEKRFTVKEPISHVNVTGNNWLQHGSLLSLKVTCKGSQNFQYCLEFKKGLYNVTGNETCRNYNDLPEGCDFPINRYIAESSQHTVVIILKNDVSKVVSQVTVTIYKVNKQAQLSVIVVPVAFSLVAVVLIVFGVAYYFQNRSRFIVEVADFNFGQQYSDMEYKTFRERLRDSIANAFTRGPSPGSSEVPVWPPGRKYGSMA